MPTPLILPGGTDVAEMALFATDLLPLRLPDAEGLRRLEREQALIRFPTGADGGYLLHIYVDEPLPPALWARCDHSDRIEAPFRTPTGRIAFGGVESAFQAFRSNPNIRADATLPAGSYEASAYRAEVPDDEIEAEIREQAGSAAVRLSAIRGPIIGLGLLGGLLLWWLGHPAGAGMLTIGLWASAWALGRHSLVRREREIRWAVSLKYPSIVVQLMRSTGSAV